MKTGNSKNKADNFAHLTEAAAALFEEKGIYYVSLGMVADACRLTRRTVINHFGSKDNLIAITVRALSAKIIEDVRLRLSMEDYQNKTGLEQLRFYMEYLRKFLFSDPRFLIFIKEIETYVADAGAASAVTEEYLANLYILKDFIASALKKGLDDGTVRGDLDMEKARYLLDGTYCALLQRLAVMLVSGRPGAETLAAKEYEVFYETVFYYLTQSPLVMRSLKSRKVLIVDDLEVNREVLSGIFADEYEILTAANGQEAIDVLSAHSDVAIVILDLQMPVMDGFGFLEIVRADRRYDDMAIVVNTIYGDAANEVRALRLGADEFIFKPFNQEVIRFRVRNVMLKYDKLMESRELRNRLLHSAAGSARS